MALLFLVLLLGPYVSCELLNQKCKYPTDNVRLPRPNKRYFLECTTAHLYEERECPADTEFDIALRNCTYKIDSAVTFVSQPSSESSGDDGNGIGKGSRVSGNKQPNQQLQWPFYPIELHSSCTSDGWCPHDPAKLQFCDVNGEQFMQCSNMGWILKICPPGSLFAGHLGRCVDPRENLQTYPPQTSQEFQTKNNVDNFPDKSSNNGNNWQQLNFNVKPAPLVTNSNGPQAFGQLSEIGSQYQTNGFPSQQLQQNVNSQQTYVPQPVWNLISSWNQNQQQAQLPVQQQPNLPQPTWNQVQQPSPWAQQVQQPQPNNEQQSWQQQQQSLNQQQWNQNQHSQTSTNGQMLPLNPAEAATLPRGELVWTTAKQPSSPQSQQQISLGSLVVDSDKLHEPWSATDYPSFVVQQNPSDGSQNPTQGSTPATYQSWSLPANSNPNIAPINNNEITDNSFNQQGSMNNNQPVNNNQYGSMNNNQPVNNNQYGSMNNNYPQLQGNQAINQNVYVHPNPNNNKIQTNFPRQPAVQQGYQPATQQGFQPAVQQGFQPAVQPVYQPAVQPVQQPAAQPAYQQSVQSVFQPASQPANQQGYQPAYQPAVQAYTNKQGMTSYYPTWNNSVTSWNNEQYQNQASNNPFANYRLYVQHGGNLIPILPSQLLMNPYYAANYQSQYPYYAYGYGYGQNPGTSSTHNNWINSYQQFPSAPNYVFQPFQQSASQNQNVQQQTVPQSWTANQLQSQTFSQQNQNRYPQNQFGQQTNVVGQQGDSAMQNFGGQNSNKLLNYPFNSNKQTSSTLRAQKGRKLIQSENKRNCTVSSHKSS